MKEFSFMSLNAVFIHSMKKIPKFNFFKGLLRGIPPTAFSRQCENQAITLQAQALSQSQGSGRTSFQYPPVATVGIVPIRAMCKLG